MIRKLLIAISLSASALSFESVSPSYEYSFPRDHFAHPEFRTEWWYYTGNLVSSEGRRFGFELTFFRTAVGKNGKGGGAWKIGDLYLAHLALSDLDSGIFYRRERLNRSGPGLAGADFSRRRIWNGNWQVKWLASEDSFDHQRLHAVSEDFALKLDLNSVKPAVIHGSNGVNQKSSEARYASHYISFTRLLASGKIRVGAVSYSVNGVAWMDHEFFTNGLAPNQIGWDWMSIQLENNTELMLYRLRLRDGRISPFSSGTYVDEQGQVQHLKSEDFLMEPHDTWRSQETGALYPVRWRVLIPNLQIVLECRAELATQEIVSRRRIAPNYWEGAVSFEGRVGGEQTRGVGYLEMTGYDQPVVLEMVEE